MSLPRNPLADLSAALADLVEDREGRRIWLVANSPGEHAQRVAERLDPAQDLLVQYNHCEHHACFDGRGVACLFFNYLDAQGLPIGFEGDAFKQPFDAYPQGSRVFFLREAALASEARDRLLEGAVAHLSLPSHLLCTDHLSALLFDAGQGFIPSSGFVSILLVHLANILRALKGLAPHRLCLSGFTGEYGANIYFRHHIFGERALWRTLPSLWVMNEAGDLVRPEDASISAPAGFVRELFSHYDAQAKDKAEILFDTAKVAYALDRLPEFFRLIREAIAANPWKGVYYFREAIAIARNNPEALAHLGLPAGDQPPKTAELDALNLRLRFPGFAAAPPQYRRTFGADAGYGPLETGPGPRVLILNDLSMARAARHHLGAFVASRNLRDGLAAQGLAVVGWANTPIGLGQILRLGSEGGFDAAILLGGGALAWGSAQGFELLQMGACLQELGKPVFLIGATCHNTSDILARLFRGFALIAVRDGKSLKQVQRMRADARLVADLCWVGETPSAAPGPRTAIGVQDSARDDMATQLEGLAAATGLDYFVMHKFAQRIHACVVQGRPLSRIPAILTEGDLGRFGGWISGRLQGSILALRQGAAVAAATDGAPALAALLADIGLDDKAIGAGQLAAATAAGGCDDPAIGRALDYAERDWRKVDAYAELARTENARLFKDIAAALS